MAENWQAGDLALCVSFPAGNCPNAWNPLPGSVCTVTHVGDNWDWQISEPWIGLDFAEDPTPIDSAQFDAVHFRKIHPLSIEERNAELAILRGRPVKEPAA